MSDPKPEPELVCTYDPLIELMARFENVRAADTSANPFEGLSVEDSLKKHIVEGIKKNLERRLDQALEAYTPLQIINDILLDGMKTVGDLFGAGKMQLPFVLQSAEVMKAAVRYLEPLMEKVEGAEKGSVLLATVAGDVHDIGKNLVDIILSNNGYRVVNIGIKQPINNILDKAREHQVQVIGLSGLLVKSTLVMRDNLIEMNERGLHHYPVLLGGAALTRGYVEQDLRAIYKGRVFYAQDAFEGLKLMEELRRAEPREEAPGSREEAPGSPGKAPGSRGEAPGSRGEAPGSPGKAPGSPGEVSGSRGEAPGSPGEVSGSPGADSGRLPSHRVGVLDPALFVFDGARSDVGPAPDVPTMPFYGAKRWDRFDIFEIYKYVNPVALFRGQWQFKRPEGMGNVEFNAWLEEQARPVFERLQKQLARYFRPQVKWGYFPCASAGNDLVIFEEDARTERLRFTFPRQRDGRRLCLSDFFASVPGSSESDLLDVSDRSDRTEHPSPQTPEPPNLPDVAAFHLVTIGPEITEYERKLFADGDYQEYMFVHGMGVETAEALAEYWHKQIRHEMGIGGNDPPDMKGLFAVRYRGCRYSFGYPACPNLEDQAKLFELLKPSDIGVELTEEYMLVPEQSTSAIICHHPEAKYFNVR